MTSKAKWILPAVLVLVIAVIAVIAATAVFDPISANPAAKTGGDFVKAVLNGSDEAAPLLDANMQAWVQDNCPGGSAAACVQSYIPAEWGALQGVVFRRSAPDGRAWNIEWIATYAADKGASGVCIYTRVEPQTEDTWAVAGWAGFIHCGDPASRNIATNPDTPNRAP